MHLVLSLVLLQSISSHGADAGKSGGGDDTAPNSSPAFTRLCGNCNGSSITCMLIHDFLLSPAADDSDPKVPAEMRSLYATSKSACCPHHNPHTKEVAVSHQKREWARHHCRTVGERCRHASCSVRFKHGMSMCGYYGGNLFGEWYTVFDNFSSYLDEAHKVSYCSARPSSFLLLLPRGASKLFSGNTKLGDDGKWGPKTPVSELRVAFFEKIHQESNKYGTKIYSLDDYLAPYDLEHPVERVRQLWDCRPREVLDSCNTAIALMRKHVGLPERPPKLDWLKERENRRSMAAEDPLAPFREWQEWLHVTNYFQAEADGSARRLQSLWRGGQARHAIAERTAYRQARQAVAKLKRATKDQTSSRTHWDQDQSASAGESKVEAKTSM